MKEYQVSICFYQYPLALNEIYNWFHEHLKQIKTFKKFNDIETNKNGTKYRSTKFLFIVDKDESSIDEIVFCIPSSIVVYNYDLEKLLIDLKLNNLDADYHLNKLLLFGAFNSDELDMIAKNFKI